MRARIYLSEIGRFAQSDPIGLASGDVNNYRYVGNDMVNRVDPSGLGGFGKIQLRQTQFRIRIPIADLLNLETVHEEYFFDDDGLSVSYYPHGINWNRENRKIYELGKNKYQDDLIREAVRILEESGNWEPEDFNRYTHNCQHFADALRWEYRWLNGKEQWRKLWMGVTRLITSLTPEDKFGPTGYDVGGTQNDELERWVASGGAFDYRIEFWNKPEAEVPTQDAIIIDRLDPAVFDLSTLKFTRIGFLNWDVALPGGQFIDMRIDCRPEMNIAVELKAGLGMEIPGFANNTDIDENTLVFWFHAIDPATGEYPADPFAGFLPPFNPETEFEIGWVEFRVDHKEDLPSGTRIENQAFVEFDFAGDIADHPAPKDGPWVNTIDTETPNSSVFPLPARIEETDFIVEWAGEDEDGGSGIASYDIYVSIDGGNYVLWLDDTEKTSVVYAGQMDHTYAFYSVVTDNVGHREALPPIPDAITKISLNSPPVAEAGEPYDVAEGGSIQLDASDSTDPDLPDEFLIYEWDFDEDGEYDDAEGINPTFSAIGFNGPDSVMVGLKVTDSYGDSDTDTAEVNVSNVGPIIELNPVTEINEDGTAVLTGTITDLGLLDTFTLTLDWGDPLSPHNLQTYVLGASETGSQTFVLSHQYLDDKPSGTPSDPYTILVTVTDDVDVGQADVTVEVANIAPEITEISCSATLSERSIEGEAVSVLVSFIDIGILDTHTAQIDWGDGTTTSGTVTESGGNGTVTGTHVYATGGIFTVAITLQDDDTGIAAANTTAVIIGVGVVDNQLHIIGTDDADSVSVAVKGGKNPTVVVDADFLGPMAGDFNKNSKLKTREFDAAGITGVLMVLCGGDDLAIVSEQSILDAIIDGGSGDDKLHGGAGNDILLGGEGDDKITGDGGADILIGGLGSDRLVGGTGDDILVSDQTAYESDESQNKLPETKGLAGIQAEWLSGKDYFERLDNITGNNPRPDRLNNGYFLRLGLTVWDDGQSDKLTGGRGKDWFLFSGDDWAVDIGGDDDDKLVY